MLRMLAPLCVLVIGLLLVSDSSSAAQKKKGAQKIQGSVIKVETASGATDEGTLLVKTLPGKKKGAADSEGKEVTYQIKKTTKIERQAGKKMPATAAAFADLQAGQRVTITSANGSTVADQVLILKTKKKKNS